MHCLRGLPEARHSLMLAEMTFRDEPFLSGMLSPYRHAGNGLGLGFPQDCVPRFSYSSRLAPRQR